MTDDVLINKAATIKRGVKRAREEYGRDPNFFAADLPAQDASILNILRVCQATLGTGQHLIHLECLVAPQSARNVLMIAPTLPRGHAARPLPRQDAKRPKFGLPRWSVGAIKPAPLSMKLQTCLIGSKNT